MTNAACAKSVHGHVTGYWHPSGYGLTPSADDRQVWIGPVRRQCCPSYPVLYPGRCVAVVEEQATPGGPGPVAVGFNEQLGGLPPILSGFTDANVLLRYFDYGPALMDSGSLAVSKSTNK